MTFNEAFQLPFRIFPGDLGIWLKDQNGRMIANFLFDDMELKKVLVDILNGDKKSVDNPPCSYQDGKIFLGDKPILLMRGWGYLTGVGALNLPADKAAEIQDSLANHIVEKLTSCVQE